MSGRAESLLLRDDFERLASGLARLAPLDGVDPAHVMRLASTLDVDTRRSSTPT